MPLKLVKRNGSEAWYVRGTVRAGAFGAQTIFESAGTSDKARARRYLDRRQAEIWDRLVAGLGATKSFLDAAEAYMEAKPPGEGDKARIGRLLDHFCPTWRAPAPDPKRYTLLRDIGQEAIDRACLKILRPGAAPATKVRGVITPATAILTHAAKRGWCRAPAFERPKKSPPRVRYLFWPEMLRLIAAMPAHLRPLVRLMAMTGARPGEAVRLDWADVALASSAAVLRDTKTGGDRTVYLPPPLVAALAGLAHRDGRVFRRPDGRPYAERIEQGGQFKTAWHSGRARAGIANFRPHDCRHHWATWFYHETKDLLQLMTRGGWSTLAMVQVYTHVLPPHTPVTVPLSPPDPCAKPVQSDQAAG